MGSQEVLEPLRAATGTYRVICALIGCCTEKYQHIFTLFSVVLSLPRSDVITNEAAWVCRYCHLVVALLPATYLREGLACARWEGQSLYLMDGRRERSFYPEYLFIGR